MEIKIGDIFSSKSRTIVNTVNCVGVMGKGIALEFKNRYPEMYLNYKELCNDGLVRPGEPYLYTDLSGTSIINFPTKDHWRSPSKLSYVINGLDWFVKNYGDLGIDSIAFPPLGCGNGGLSWDVIGPIMYSKLKNLPIDIEIYAPFGTSREKITVEYLENHLITSPEEIIGNQITKINKYWYLILYVIQRLNSDEFSLSVGRTIRQKICYVLTRAGIPTGFSFSKNSYGPYSEEVNNAIVVLSNANLLTEVQLGKMIETRVSSDFLFDDKLFTAQELNIVEKVIDLLSRVKDTFQAEMLTTILFAYDQIKEKECNVTERDIVEYVLDWKSRWEDNVGDIILTIKELSEIGWIKPDASKEFYEYEDFI